MFTFFGDCVANLGIFVEMANIFSPNFLLSFKNTEQLLKTFNILGACYC